MDSAAFLFIVGRVWGCADLHAGMVAFFLLQRALWITATARNCSMHVCGAVFLHDSPGGSSCPVGSGADCLWIRWQQLHFHLAGAAHLLAGSSGEFARPD